MSTNSTIKCPDCGSDIQIEVTLLLQGGRFRCNNANCNVSISLSSESETEATAAYEKLESLKNQLAAKEEPDN